MLLAIFQTEMEGKMDTAAFKKLLNKKNFRLTRQRIAVLNVIAQEENRHLSATEIYEIVKDKNPGIGLATVYKNLRMLEQEGILCKIELSDKTAHYEINNTDSIHCHLICVKCGKIIEIKGVDVQNVIKFLQSDSHFTFQQGSINFYGICENCEQISKHVFSASKDTDHSS